MNLHNMKNKFGKFILKYKITIIISFVLSLLSCFIPTDYTEQVKEQLKNIDILISKQTEIEADINAKDVEIAKLNVNLTTSNTEIETLNNEKNKIQAQVDEKQKKEKEAQLAAEKAAAEAKVAEEKAAAEAKAAVEKAKREAEEKAKIEAEARKYDTGITWEDMARDSYGRMGEYVTLSGEILQVMNGSGYNQYRMAVYGDYDKVVLIEISTDKLSSNILEGDYITVKGLSSGNMTYTTVLGAKMTIPSVIVDSFTY